MAQAQITVNGVAGSDDDVPIDVVVSLDNTNAGGETTYAWSLVDQPPGTTDSLSSTSAQNPTFTPKKEGTYLVQLVVNAGPAQLVDRVVVGVRQLKSRERVPAAQETTEDGARGWAGAAGSMLQRLDALLADQGTMIAVAGAAGLVRGDVLAVTGRATIKGGLPGEEVLPSATKMLATSASDSAQFLMILDAGVDGSTAPSSGDLVRVRLFGLFDHALALGGSPAVGDPLFLSDAGALSLTAGTNSRQCGTVAAVVSGDVVPFFYGSAGIT